MSKAVFLAEIEAEYLADEASRPQIYWTETKSLNTLFTLFEENNFLPSELYLGLRPHKVKTWKSLLKIVEQCLETKAYHPKVEAGSFDHDAFFKIINEFLDNGRDEISNSDLIFCYFSELNSIKVDKSIAPVRDLLITLEKIIGNECYNINKTEPWQRWGLINTTLPRYRYPLTFGPEANVKVKEVTPAISNLDLISGRYTFGANQLDIFRGIHKVLVYLQDNGYLKEDVITESKL
jgi:hypothetical protein